MQSDINCAAKAQTSAQPPLFQKRIGSTAYRVTVHFSQTSKETVEDRVIRLMESEVRESA